MTGTPSGLPRLYTPAEVAEALRCSTWWVQEQVRRRRFPHCEVAGGHRFTTEHYAAILRLCEVLPAEEAPPIRPQRGAVPPVETPTAGLRARVPRRLRGLAPTDVAA
ncbi:hypothetical protein EDD30_5789 [Couchioplanes caeruleus]|uniref:Excisionase family DNA binding protein n=1 Tax=Couchioplanes caeruleus TaxID=56438 RepID=A0A3N1GRH1_9ACTN|nr:hypothetical protein EDD30_5789 [Couchioplanes caeruleus]